MAYVLDQVEADRVWAEVVKYLEEIRKSTPEDAMDNVSSYDFASSYPSVMLLDEDDGMSEGD